MKSRQRLPEIPGEAAASLPNAGTRLPGDSGVILIALLWILTALAIIALSFSRETFVEVAAARNAQSLEDAYFVARAGIAATAYQLLQRKYSPQVRQAELKEEPDPLELGIVNGTLNGGTYQVNVQDESGKISVNRISEEQLRSLTEAAGIKKEDAEVIVDSILDWRDTDVVHRPNGAEDDYYMSLNPPYEAKNGKIETIEELLLIRGITPEYFYGRPERDQNGAVIYKYGLSRYLTAYSERNQVNVNYAPLSVLLAIPGMPPDAARAIYERRLTKPFRSTLDITREMGISVGPTTMAYLGVDMTGTYTLTASARAANSKARRVIRTVISLDAVQSRFYRTLYWNENVPDYEGIKP